MKNLKNQKGITLVALVVTIIVLLILAGVSLSLVAGSNGIMTRTVAARDKNEIATAKERGEMAIAELQMEWYEGYYANGDRSENFATLNAYMKNKSKKMGDYTVTVDAAGTGVTVAVSRASAPEDVVTGTLSYTTGGTGTTGNDLQVSWN